jgi:hypothetical protein
MDNFDLKKYLVENKVTANSRILTEGTENVMNTMAKAIMDYYNDIDGIQNTDVKELRQDLKFIIKDNKDNAELVAAFENVLNQPVTQYNRITRKLWHLASDMYDNYISNFNPHSK